jgi:hypothetical protein
MESFNRFTPSTHCDEYVLVSGSYGLAQQESLICVMSQRKQICSLFLTL